MASYMAASHWLCAFPTEAGSSKSVKERIASAMIEVAGKPLADVHAFAVPTLRVGSLDGLMALTDELSRADAFVEGVLKKVERQVAESYNVLKLAELVRAAGASARVQPTLASVPPLGLRCAGRPLLDYVGDFKWDADSWDVKDPLPDLLKRMLTAAEKVDADIRSATTAYQEKRTAMLTAERKRRWAWGVALYSALAPVFAPAKCAKRVLTHPPTHLAVATSCLRRSRTLSRRVRCRTRAWSG